MVRWQHDNIIRLKHTSSNKEQKPQRVRRTDKDEYKEHGHDSSAGIEHDWQLWTYHCNVIVVSHNLWWNHKAQSTANLQHITIHSQCQYQCPNVQYCWMQSAIQVLVFSALNTSSSHRPAQCYVLCADPLAVSILCTCQSSMCQPWYLVRCIP